MRRPREAVFFVDRASQNDGWPARRLLLGQASDGTNHRGHAPFDVARAAAIEPAAIDFGREWFDRHPFDGHRVLVRFEHHDLATAMERHVASYRDEWAGVLDDPDRLGRFVTFVNAPGTPDPDITFVTERDQPRPALITGPKLSVVAP